MLLQEIVPPLVPECNGAITIYGMYVMLTRPFLRSAARCTCSQVSPLTCSQSFIQSFSLWFTSLSFFVLFGTTTHLYEMMTSPGNNTPDLSSIIISKEQETTQSSALPVWQELEPKSKLGSAEINPPAVFPETLASESFLACCSCGQSCRSEKGKQRPANADEGSKSLSFVNS